MQDEYYLITFKAECSVVTKEVFELTHPIANGLRPNLCISGEYCPCSVELIDHQIEPGEKGILRVRAITNLSLRDKFSDDEKFEFREGLHLLANCRIVEVEHVEQETIKPTK